MLWDTVCSEVRKAVETMREEKVMMDSITSTIIQFIPIKGPLVTIMGKPSPLSQGKSKCLNEILGLSILNNKSLNSK
jgi:hypothetical protein